MVTVVRPNNITIDTEQQAIDYLVAIASTPNDRFGRGQGVTIINRSQVPAGVASFDVGIVIESPQVSTICWILVMNDNGSPAIIAIPKDHIV